MSQPLNNNVDQKILMDTLNRNAAREDSSQRANMIMTAWVLYAVACDITSCTQCSNIESEYYKKHGDSEKASCSGKCSASFTLLTLFATIAVKSIEDCYNRRCLTQRDVTQI